MDQVSLQSAGLRPDEGYGEEAAGSARPAGLRPALFARYDGLTRLRYDFPLVLVEGEGSGPPVRSLTSIVDGILRDLAPPGPEGEVLRRQVLRLEEGIRIRVSRGEAGRLSILWKRTVAEMLAASGEPVFGPLATNLDRARDALSLDGAVVDCDEETPHEVLVHVWARVHAAKAKAFRKKVDGLILRLSDILKADFMKSDAAHTEVALRSSFGTSYESAFDFKAMSGVLSRGPSEDRLSEDRKRRLEDVLRALRSQRFFGPGRASERKPGQPEPYSFVFDSCAAALDAFRDRLPEMLEFVKALTIAELEIENKYRVSLHDPVFARFDESDLSETQLALFPSYLVCLRDGRSDPAETVRAFETLASGLPVKVLVQTDDILGPTSPEPPRASFGAGSARLAAMAIGLNDAYVYQTASANLYRAGERLVTGMRYDGPALFCIFSGATPHAPGLPPYLLAAAAAESRVFPTFAYDPAAGSEWAARFDIGDNPQPTADWPLHELLYEDHALQRITEEAPFTCVDFTACDRRYARYYEPRPYAEQRDSMIPLGEYLKLPPAERGEQQPYIMTIDMQGGLYRTVVDEKLMDAAGHCNDAWRRLQELGGVNNSHANRLLAKERARWTEQKERELDELRERLAGAAAPPPAAAPLAEVVKDKEVEEIVEEAESEAVSADDPWIETVRCTTCNECTQINNKMFVYDDNMQAYIADADAGTYRQIVEAAESCQVSIIHPGKPRNPAEANLPELIARAEPFQ